MLTTKYERYLRSNEWRSKRNQRLKIDGHKCVYCGAKEHLNVHHLTYENVGHEKMCDLITLCQECHTRLHKGNNWYENDWIRGLGDKSLVLVDLEMLCRLLRVLFGEKGRALAFILSHNNGTNVIAGDYEDFAAKSLTQRKTMFSVIKKMREMDYVRKIFRSVKSASIVVNPLFVRPLIEPIAKVKEEYDSLGEEKFNKKYIENAEKYKLNGRKIANKEREA